MNTTRTPRTSEQVLRQQKLDADREHAAKQAALATSPAAPLPAVVDPRPPSERYLDEIAPSSVIGRLCRFNGKDGKFVTVDDGEPMDLAAIYVAICDLTRIGWVKFNDGAAPDRVDGFWAEEFDLAAARRNLGDQDESAWPLGLNGLPEDPWKHEIALPLMLVGGDQYFTFVAMNITSRRAVGSLLRVYKRMPGDVYPIVRLSVGGYESKIKGVGHVAVPVLTVVGRQPRTDRAPAPQLPLTAELNDAIPF